MLLSYNEYIIENSSYNDIVLNESFMNKEKIINILSKIGSSSDKLYNLIDKEFTKVFSYPFYKYIQSKIKNMNDEQKLNFLARVLKNTKRLNTSVGILFVLSIIIGGVVGAISAISFSKLYVIFLFTFYGIVATISAPYKKRANELYDKIKDDIKNSYLVGTEEIDPFAEEEWDEGVDDNGNLLKADIISNGGKIYDIEIEFNDENMIDTLTNGRRRKYYKIDIQEQDGEYKYKAKITNFLEPFILSDFGGTKDKIKSAVWLKKKKEVEDYVKGMMKYVEDIDNPVYRRWNIIKPEYKLTIL
jgi:hypothetical protein